MIRTDLHTHILPNMDDGAENTEAAISMLKCESEQGVEQVILTPHFYGDKEAPESFLDRRERSYSLLCSEIEKKQISAPRLILGAEVFYIPNMTRWEMLSELCIENTSYILLELPFSPWKKSMLKELYSLILDMEIIPIFAHLERYLKIQPKEYISDILALQTPIQINALRENDFFKKRALIKAFKNCECCVLGTDCHNMTSRPPQIKYSANKKIIDTLNVKNQKL